MRIALNALNLPRNLAGIGFYTAMLADHLLKADPGLAITVFTNAEAAEGLRLDPRIGVSVLGSGSATRKSLASQFSLPGRLRGFDLAHSVGNVGLMLGSIPQVVTIHDLCQRVIPERFGPAKRAWLNLGQRWTEWKRCRVITVSEATRNDLLRYHPGYGPLVETVHSASKYPIDEGEAGPRSGFLFVGTLEPGKRLDLALEALALLKRRHGIAKRMAVVGAKGWKQTGIPALIADLEIGNQVEFLGYLPEEELRMRYKAAECLVFPSAYEGFGFPLLEAQSQGCPVVSADNSSLPEVGGDGCHYFPSGDAAALAALLARGQNHPDAIRSRVAAGFANCRRFSWEATARKTLAVYRKAIQDR